MGDAAEEGARSGAQADNGLGTVGGRQIEVLHVAFGPSLNGHARRTAGTWPAVAWNHVSNLPVLFRKYKETHRRYVELERELVDLDRQILAAGRSVPKPRRHRAEPLAATDEVRGILRVLREAEGPLPPREIASRLGVDTVLVSRRLVRARRLGYVERTGKARYRVSNSVPSL